MSKSVKRRVGFQFPYYHEMEEKLERYAEEGLFLEKIGTTFWTFYKAEPQKINYKISFFAEGCEFNPNMTENQEVYLDYAKESDWEFVDSYEQMHVFCSAIDNPIPFETDEVGMLDNLENMHHCMKKLVIKPSIFQAALWSFYALTMTIVYTTNPMRLLESNMLMAMVVIVAIGALIPINVLIDYYRAYHKSKKALELGMGEVVIRNSGAKIRNRFFLFIMTAMLVVLFWEMRKYVGANIAILTLSQVPIYMIFFFTIKKFLKKRNVSARTNKIISYSVSIFIIGLYAALTSHLMISDRTLDTSETVVIEESIFIKTVAVADMIEFTDGTEQEIYHETYTSPFDIIMKLKKEDVLLETIWREVIEMNLEVPNIQKIYKVIDLDIDQEIREYIFIYDERIILLQLEAPVTESQLQELCSHL